MVSVQHRLEMARLACQGDSLFDVSDIEAVEPGPSYTILTARRLRALGWSVVNWLIGADMLAGLPTWHQFDALLREVQFTIVARPGHPIDWNSLPEAIRGLRNSVVEVPPVNISATQIRSRVAAGLPIDGLAPPAVVKYIAAHNLYR